MKVNRNACRAPHYGLRKVATGLASVLLSTTLYLGFSSVTNAHADTVPQQTTGQTLTNDREVVGVNSSVASSAVPANSSISVDNSNVSSANTTIPSATHSLDDQVGTNIQVTSAAVTSINGSSTTQGATAGATNLQLGLQVSGSAAQEIKAGDYIDIKLGLQYEDTATGATHILSYGKVNATPQSIYLGDQLVGYIVGIDDSNAYVATTAQSSSTVTAPQWTLSQKSNIDPTQSTGGTNGYYRLIFNDYLQSHQAVAAKLIQRNLTLSLNWYNPFNKDGQIAPLTSSSFYLITNKDGVTSYQPQSDLQVGNVMRTSGVTIKVKKISNSQNLNQTIGYMNTTTNIAHHWVQRENGQWVVLPLTDTQQAVGIHLSNAAGQDFTIKVTKPADSSVAIFNFASAEAVQAELQKYIVGQQKSYTLDSLTANGNYYVNSQYLTTSPKVTVTMTSNGLTAEYHVTIDGKYAGFQNTSNGSILQDSPLTLIIWQPTKVADLLPADGISTPDEDKAHEYNDGYYGGVEIKGSALEKYLSTNPWSAKVIGSNGQVVFNGGNNGYWVDYQKETNTKVPNNAGIAQDDMIKSVNQVIHFVNEQGATVEPDVVRSVTFSSSDGQTYYNQTNSTTGHETEGSFSNIDLPMIDGYEAYLAIIDNNGNPVKDANGNIEVAAHTITKVGAETYFNANHGNFTIYVVYKSIQQNVIIKFVDDDNNGAQVGDAIIMNGVTDQTISLGLTVPTNYQLATGQNLPTSYTFKHSGNKPIIIHLVHKTVTENNSRHVIRTIIIHSSEVPAQEKQVETISQTVTRDLVTGKVVSMSPWTTATYPEYTFNLPSGDYTMTVNGASYVNNNNGKATISASPATRDETVDVTFTYNTADYTIVKYVAEDGTVLRTVKVYDIHHTGMNYDLNAYATSTIVKNGITYKLLSSMPTYDKGTGAVYPGSNTDKDITVTATFHYQRVTPATSSTLTGDTYTLTGITRKITAQKVGNDYVVTGPTMFFSNGRIHRLVNRTVSVSSGLSYLNFYN